MHPKRFSDADRALRDALERLDPEGLAEALIDGADPDMPDGEGSSPLFWLYHKLYVWDGRESFFGLDSSVVDERAAACADVLMSLGAAPYPWHAATHTPEQENECLEREHDCRDCPWSDETVDHEGIARHGMRWVPVACDRIWIWDYFAHSNSYGSMAEMVPRAYSTYEEWSRRYGMMDEPRYLGLLASGRERLEAERQRRALWKEGAAGESEKASSSITL